MANNAYISDILKTTYLHMFSFQNIKRRFQTFAIDSSNLHDRTP